MDNNKKENEFLLDDDFQLDENLNWELTNLDEIEFNLDDMDLNFLKNISETSKSSQFSESNSDMDKTTTISDLLDIRQTRETSALKRLESSSGISKKTRKRSVKLLKRDELFLECEKYELKNRELKRKIDEIQAEVDAIKNLILSILVQKSLK